ncbi:hypothetical protein COO60DRAFT_239235 [Scenedesmus sp. NREL 46B-D3]|nr:hypothetical protein COO60DRAFT_239235 [Scenedesmus sp. NREL 46B-D3]
MAAPGVQCCCHAVYLLVRCSVTGQQFMNDQLLGVARSCRCFRRCRCSCCQPHGMCRTVCLAHACCVEAAALKPCFPATCDPDKPITNLAGR